MRLSPALLLVVALAAAAPARAQVSDTTVQAARALPDLRLPEQPSRLTVFSNPEMALYRPDGPGPFPALVLLHQCGGLGGTASVRWRNLSMLTWAREGVQRGYVVLQLDALGPRGVDSVCQGPGGGVTFARGARDALLAAAYLRGRPDVIRNRIGFAGFSWGGGVGLLAANDAVAARLVDIPDRFDAVVAVYPPCRLTPLSGSPYTLVLPGLSTPLLVLMGGADNETPPEDCIAGLAPQRDAGSAIAWTVFPDTTHCFDCENLDGKRKTGRLGQTIEYRYNRARTQEAALRLFEHLDQAFTATDRTPPASR